MADSISTGKVGAIFKQNENSLAAFTDEGATLGVDNKTLSITDDTLRYFDKTTLVVEKDGIELDSSNYMIEIGKVIFHNEQTAGTYTISGSSYAIEQISGFFQFSFDLTTKVEDITEFGCTDELCIPTTNNWKASADYFYKVNNTQQADIEQYQKDQTEVILQFVLNSTDNVKKEGYGYITSLQKDAGIGVTKGKIEFTGNGILMDA